ncbi:MAG: trigger factor [Lachnospiraceae bacterium]|nr:trigger factor [Lachnospiraceae bacterium]
MSVQVENLEHNMAKLTVTVDASAFEKALNQAYNREKKQINIPGFRKGKAPRKLIEAEYGKNVFYEGAGNILIQDEYPKAYDESGLEIVSQPEIEITQMESGKDFIFTATVAVKPEVKLGKYAGVTVTKIDTTVSDEDVDKEVETQLNNNARTVTVDREIQDKDTADINFEGFVDGKAFEGGKGENYKLEIGSHSFIDTFEDQLIGKKAGDDVEVNVTFPENYQASELAGKPALFKVHVNSVSAKEVPELNDDFAGDQGFDTVDEYKADVKKHLEENKENAAKRTKEEEAIAKIVADAEMDIPDAMVKSQEDSMINEMAQNMARQGLSMQQYFQFTGTTMEQLREQVKPDALKRIQNSLVLEAIADAEKIEASDEDVDADIKKTAEQYGMKFEDLVKNVSDTDRENIKADLRIQKAIDFVMDNCKERKKPERKAKTEDKDQTENKEGSEE